MSKSNAKPSSSGAKPSSSGSKPAQPRPTVKTMEKIPFYWDREKFVETPKINKDNIESLKLLDDYAANDPLLKTKVPFDSKFDRYEKTAFYYKDAIDKNNAKLMKLREDVAAVLMAHAKAYSRETSSQLETSAELERQIQNENYDLHQLMRRSVRDWRLAATKIVCNKNTREELKNDPNKSKLLPLDEKTILSRDTSWDPDHLIPIQDITVEEKANIGQGAFGIVKKALVYGNIVAMKVLRKDPVALSTSDSVTASIALQNAQTAFEVEIRKLSSLDHDYILKFIGATYSPSEDGKAPAVCALLTEFADNGSLHDVLHKSTDIKLSFNRKMTIVREFVEGMIYLHNREEPILHLDIKPGNVLLDAYYHARIADFGMSKVLKGTFSAGFVGGTPLYMAPEVTPTKERVIFNRVSTKCDTYSFGVMLNELILEVIPYSDVSQFVEKTFENLITLVNGGEKPGTNRPTIVTDNEPLQTLIARCWGENPDKRPTFSDILKEAPWDKALKVYSSTGTRGSESLADTFKGKASIAFKEWVKQVAIIFAVTGILNNENDPHYKALAALNGIGNIAEDITYEKSSRFALWTSGIPNKDNEFTSILYRVVTSPWFFGIMTSAAAIAILSQTTNKSAGTYMVRWDEVDNHWYITYNAKKDKKSKEIMVLEERLTFNEIKGLEEAVNTFKKKTKLISSPALPQRYEGLVISPKFKFMTSQNCYFNEDSKNGYAAKNYIYLM